MDGPKQLKAQNYILKFRKKRSVDLNDMNCIEWVVRGLEINGLKNSRQYFDCFVIIGVGSQKT